MNKSSKSLAQTLNQEHVAGLVCTSPFIIGLFAFLLIPMGMSLYYSLCNYNNGEGTDLCLMLWHLVNS